MQIFLTYIQVFAVGGVVCFIGQLLINKTKMSSARILVIFLLVGVVLETIGVFKYIEEFGKAGITIPIIGFGSTIVKGVIEGAKKGFLYAITSGLSSVSAGLTSAIFFGFIFALIFKSHSKRK